jgi:hypothetical protein
MVNPRRSRPCSSLPATRWSLPVDWLHTVRRASMVRGIYTLLVHLIPADIHDLLAQSHIMAYKESRPPQARPKELTLMSGCRRAPLPTGQIDVIHALDYQLTAAYSFERALQERANANRVISSNSVGRAARVEAPTIEIRIRRHGITIKECSQLTHRRARR